MNYTTYSGRVHLFIQHIQRALSLKYKTPVVFETKKIYTLRDSSKIMFRIFIQKSNFVIPEKFIRLSYDTYVLRKKIAGVLLSDIQTAPCTKLFSLLKELLHRPRTHRFITKNYTRSLTDIVDIKSFLIKYLTNLKFLSITPSAPTKFLTTMASSNPLGGPEDSITPSMALTYGGLMWNKYSACGGSRLYLSTTTTPDTYGNTRVNYLNLDCTKNIIISTDVNISTMKAGCVFTFYLVPMLTKDNDPTGIRYNGLPDAPINPVLVNSFNNLNGIYDAEYGVGYRDAQGISVNGTAEPCIEIDLFELTLCNAQVTTHGYMTDHSIDRFGSYQNAWGSTGVYVNGVFVQDNKFDKTSTNPPFGPGTMFQINSLETFNVSSSITIDGTTLTLVTTITQENNGKINKIILAPPPSSFITDGKLEPLLSTMQLVSAIWVTDTLVNGAQTTSVWLDGIEETTQIKSYAQGQTAVPPKTPAGSSINALDVLQNSDAFITDKISYDYSYKMGYHNTENSQQYGPIFARYQNVQIQQFNLPTNLTPCWSLDYIFRALSTLSYWHGFYGQSYGIAYAPKSIISDYKQVLLNPTSYYDTVTGGLTYTTPTPANYFAELTGLGVTDKQQIATIKANYGNGYSLTNGSESDLKKMNSYQINYLATPDLITFSTLSS